MLSPALIPSVGTVRLPQYPCAGKRLSRELLTKLLSLLFPDCDSLQAVNLEPFNRLPRVL